jgi:hypothetical protein
MSIETFKSVHTRFKKLVLLTALLLPAVSERLLAQASPTATSPGPFISVGVTAAAFRTNYGEQNLGGIGAYADLNPHRDYGVEVEYQTLRFHAQQDIKQTTILAGPRIAYGSHRLVPYVKFLAGRGEFDFPFGYAVGHYFVMAPGGGVDYALNRRIRVRLQAEYQIWPKFTYGSLQPYGASVGVSYTFYRRRGWTDRSER